MGRLEGGGEGTQIMPNNELYYWILTLTEFTGMFQQITYLLPVCEKLILRWIKIIFAYLTTGNKLQYCTWSLKSYYQLPLVHCTPFNVSLSMAWITGFLLQSKPICQEYKGHFHPPVQIPLLNGSVLKCQTPVLKKALRLPKILLNK
jgi:hypothetical protein